MNGPAIKACFKQKDGKDVVLIRNGDCYLTVSPEQWDAFLEMVKAGKYDELPGPISNTPEGMEPLPFDDAHLNLESAMG